MLMSFVIEYDRRTGAVRVEEFTGERANRAGVLRRLELERARTDKNIEIVSLVSDSLETIRSTHSRYFMAELA
ncbi:hypothetical protein [Promicromonospora soli]|uniref:Uncharacterized protein n=1 Tax=Promicromonospora soli TaxID=2035533 RepID=A0A919G0N8_9MICO|nr:hypothetical protein [Promicromonospora soli]GHH76007.1 hypothetical protein GCM10017772_33380 [Promicromonospora soli]